MTTRGEELSRAGAWALALTATLTMAVSYVDRQALAVLAPTVTRELGISEEGYGWLIAAFSIAYLVSAPLAGVLIDRVGARRGLLGAVLVWSAVAAMHALAPTFGVLIALRIALGLAESPSFPGAAQTVNRALPPADQARGFGVLFTGSSLGAMAAPLIAIPLEQRWGFRAAFLGTAAIGLLWVPIWVTIAFSRAGRRALDRRHADHAPSPAGGPRPERPRALSVVVHPAVLRALVVILGQSPILAFVLLWTSKYLVHDHGLTQAEVKPYLVVPPLFYDVGAILFGHLASRRARIHGAGQPPRALFALAAGMCMLAAAVPLGRGPAEAIAIAGLCMVGAGAISALTMADMLTRVHPSVVSTAGGVSAAAQSLAYIVVNPLIGRALGSGAGYPAVFMALGAVLFPVSMVWLLWTPPPLHEERQEQQPADAALD